MSKVKQSEVESLFRLKELNAFGKDEQEFLVRTVIGNQHPSAELVIARSLWVGLTVSQLYNKIDQIKRGKNTTWALRTEVLVSHSSALGCSTMLPLLSALMAWKTIKGS